MRVVAFLLIVLLLTPAMLIGMVCYMTPILVSRGRVCGTAYEPFTARLLAHLLGSRPDPAAAQLADALPATNRLTQHLVIKPLTWACQVSGYTPSFLRIPVDPPFTILKLVGARTEFFDRAMLESVVAGDQVVILGAGWDTRAYHMLQDLDVTFFEVDSEATQEVKRSAVDATGLDDSAVTFVACEFERQNWLDALEQHGFRRDCRTFVLWEGVSMYLEESAVDQTLRSVAKLPSGSRIACDFFSRDMLRSTFLGRLGRWAIWMTHGERMRFGFPTTPGYPKPLTTYLEERGLVVERLQSIGASSPDGPPPYGTILARTPDRTPDRPPDRPTPRVTR